MGLSLSEARVGENCEKSCQALPKAAEAVYGTAARGTGLQLELLLELVIQLLLKLLLEYLLLLLLFSLQSTWQPR